MKLWYLSFVKDDGWAGGCYVEADNIIDAAARAWRLDCNPGGEVMGLEIPEDFAKDIPEKDRNRVLRREDLGDAVSLGEFLGERDE